MYSNLRVNVEANQSNDSYFESTFRSIKRYTRRRKRTFCICFVVMAIVSFTTVVFLINWPSEAESQRSMPFITDKNDTGLRNKHNETDVAAETKYLLNSTACRVQDFPPFHDDIPPYFTKETFRPCTKLPLLSSVTVNPNGTHTLKFHKENIPHYIQGTRLFCCYSIMMIDFETADLNADSMEIGECQALEDDVLLNQTVEYVQVACHMFQTTAFFDNESIDLYKNVHAFVGMKPQVKTKLDQFRKSTPIYDVEERMDFLNLTRFHDDKEKNVTLNETKPYSIMIFGIDSMSRLNFLRTMPKTARYLEKNGWFPVKIHNKVGENTLPNLAAAVLAGTDIDTLDSTCWGFKNVSIDGCPWIFKKFSEKGYITAYGEDTPQVDTFKGGKFSKSPTDYFLRPFMRAAERLSNDRWFERFLKRFDCLGPVHGVEHVLNYSVEFAKTFKNYPTFSLFWLNIFSHDCLNCPGPWDEKIMEYFENLESIRQNTVVVFMSDHGIGGEGFRQTVMGFFESNLPFLYISVPESFSNKYPVKFENLIENENKLTSPYDVHLTLLDLLGEDKFAPGCPKCFSLFEKIPENRTCDEAGVPERYCACTEYDIVSNTTPFKFLATFVLEELNIQRKSFEFFAQQNTKCVPFSLKGMKPIRIAIPPRESGYQSIVRSIKNKFLFKSDERNLFLVTIETIPRAIFEATVSQNENGTLKIESNIARLDQYEKSSKCMDHQDGKQYCVCESKQVEF